MISKLAIFLSCLTIATSCAAASEEGLAPAAQPSMQPVGKPKKTKPKEAAPPCPRGGQQKDDPICLGASDLNASPTRVKGYGGGRAGDNATTPKLFLKGPGQNIIDDPNLKQPIGGGVGLKFQF
ncbi:hypothetical protein OGR47_12140 [Methylocystis sp. MJC1]|jgi:hypothetical protein|uniref:hypothetical protein n=1 Tax=Methylocystis sp. MJC1 TaxID=2654282 RepID=UPI0013EA8769|nr:hypothetical protein [Methylocystis sp. MJC1]KAF2990834.1 hypothetical protein MJC1_01932 [Methylocystis sp. MJC1]MBU6527728.1 hypothetical protein [Methylocystis sp. MJC1]UZX10664.1 hypothetical protein OGR47_12140 [Methylocystis sp. MJC1]